jgi:hypothetical protein
MIIAGRLWRAAAAAAHAAVHNSMAADRTAPDVTGKQAAAGGTSKVI